MQKTVVLTRRDVEDLLPMRECIEVMERALRELATGRAFQPLRTVSRTSDAVGLLGLMPAWRGGEEPLWSLKEICVFPDNPSRGLDTHLGAVLLHSGRTGELLAIVNAAAITAIRTAAVTAVATRILARTGARTLAIIGTGAQARSHVAALACERDLARVVIAGRTRERATALATELQPKYEFPIEPAASIEDAVRAAEIVVTVTSSAEPVLRREWIRDGAHVNLVGSSVKHAREADGPTIAAARLYVDRRESCVNESGDYLMALREGAITPDHIVAEIGEVLRDPAKGRRDDREITIFKSLGLGIEDLAAAAHAYAKASARGVGSRIEFDR